MEHLNFNEQNRRQTPKFQNQLSFDFSHIQASNMDQNFQSKIYNDIISNKSNDIVINPDNVSILNKNNDQSNFSSNSDIAYAIDFKKEEITVKVNSPNFHPSLAFYKFTFENYISDTEYFLKNKYKKNKKKIKNIEIKMEILRAKMITKMINEIFELRNFIVDKKSSLNFINQKVDHSIKFILKINIPNNELKFFSRYKSLDKYNSFLNNSDESHLDCINEDFINEEERIKIKNSENDEVVLDVNNIQNEAAQSLLNNAQGNISNSKSENINNNQRLIRPRKKSQVKSVKKINESKFLQEILENYSNNNPTLSNNLNYSPEDYRTIIENLFSEVRFTNPRDYRVLTYCLNEIKFDFVNFIKFICIFLQFSQNLLTKIKIIGKQVHFFVFTDDENYLKIAEEHGYHLELSQDAKKYLLDNFRHNDNLITNINSNYNHFNQNFHNSNNESLSENVSEFNKIKGVLTKNIFVPFTNTLMKFYKFHNSKNDLIIDDYETINNAKNQYANGDIVKINVLKKNDKIKILKYMVSRVINLKYILDDPNIPNENSKSESIIEKPIFTNNDYYQNELKEKITYIQFGNIIYENDQTIIEYINQWCGFEKANLFSFLLNLIRFTIIFVVFLICFYIFEKNSILKLYNVNISGVPLDKVLSYFYSFTLMIWMNVFYFYWGKMQKNKFITLGINCKNSLLENKCIKNETTTISAIFSIKFSLETDFNKLMNYFTSYIMLFLCAILSISSCTILEEYQHPPEKKKSNVDFLFGNLHKVINKDLINGFIPYIIGIIICVFSKFFNNLNKKFTRYENHAFEIDYKISYITKNIIFNSINFYSLLYYIIFFKVYTNKCPNNNCLNFISMELTRIFIGIIITNIFYLSYEYFFIYKSKKCFDEALFNTSDKNNGKINNNPEDINYYDSLIQQFKFSYKYIFSPHEDEFSNINKLTDVILIIGFIFQFSLLTTEVFFWFLIYIIILSIFQWKFLFKINSVDFSINYDFLKIFNSFLFFLIIISTFSNVYILFFIIGIDPHLLSKENYIIGYVIIQNLFIILIFMFFFLKSNSFSRIHKEITKEFLNSVHRYLKYKSELTNKIIFGNLLENNIHEEAKENVDLIKEDVDDQNQQMQISIPVPGDEN